MGQMLPIWDAPIAVVDDDASVRDALSLLLKIEGFAPEAADGESFLGWLQSSTPCCVILDLQLPGRSGLAVLRQLSDIHFAPPVFVISGQSDVAMAVEAMKLGALDFLEKPFSAGAMIERVREAVLFYRRSAAGHIDGLADFPGSELLTRRERDVLGQVAHGASNKEAGRRLGISPRTIEVHRARIMDKLGARNAADLMRIVLSNAPAPAMARQFVRAG
ncbi:MAG: response regulator transcription factor [Candidatus Afipia apatlaquensis]|uniref:Response regulator transcription factor n=1 Tax=Candidatus Afipia apatlaquensis TaxID=2712852 RepID=A0A7C9RJ53_9BRAD|nr:response regulator transcription factor [Candidatus Afipia apatlaquensis]